ncbi:major facilitator superfamily domain-containing protein [Myxozyma melibiosi]|uniref:Major facilitator superfamily domain-containing protein n=1 Tax=Myxozyma melibiosi TaxID=54550 RepID=A0ABR1FB30_9ASCO
MAEKEQTDGNHVMFEQRDEEWRAYMNKRLVRKIDMKLLPFLVLMYLLNFLDRSNLAQARLGTLEEDLNMKGNDYNLATSILFVGYLLMQLPSNLFITRVRPSVFLGAAMSIWGLISGLQATIGSFGGLVACRFCLGIVEAPFFPGAVMLMSSWYTRAEIGHRIAWFYCGNAIAQMFGGLIGAGVLGNMNGTHGIAGWRWLFIIDGSITVGVAITSMFFLPDFPSAKCKWLSEEDLNYAHWRITIDMHESEDLGAVTLKDGLKMAFKDYRVYIFILFQHLSLLTQTFQYFLPTIVNSLGFGHIESLLLTAPVWFLTFIVSLVATYTSGRFNDRSIHIVVLMGISLFGNVLVVATLNTAARFVGMFFLPMGAFTAYEIIVAWIANTFPRPSVKRSAVVAICNMLGNTATIYGTYLYPSSTGPRYLMGGASTAAFCIVTAIVAWGIRLMLERENRFLEKLENENLEELPQIAHAMGRGFRYIV